MNKIRVFMRAIKRIGIFHYIAKRYKQLRNRGRNAIEKSFIHSVGNLVFPP